MSLTILLGHITKYFVIKLLIAEITQILCHSSRTSENSLNQSMVGFTSSMTHYISIIKNQFVYGLKIVILERPNDSVIALFKMGRESF